MFQFILLLGLLFGIVLVFFGVFLNKEDASNFKSKFGVVLFLIGMLWFLSGMCEGVNLLGQAIWGCH